MILEQIDNLVCCVLLVNVFFPDIFLGLCGRFMQIIERAEIATIVITLMILIFLLLRIIRNQLRSFGDFQRRTRIIKKKVDQMAI